MLPVSLDCSCLIVHIWLPLQCSLTFICLVSPMLPVSRRGNQIWTIKHEQSRETGNIGLTRQINVREYWRGNQTWTIKHEQIKRNWQHMAHSLDCSCLIVHVWLPLQYSLAFICLVSPMLPVSLDCSCLI
jgi:hypothetical protein